MFKLNEMAEYKHSGNYTGYGMNYYCPDTAYQIQSANNNMSINIGNEKLS